MTINDVIYIALQGDRDHLKKYTDETMKRGIIIFQIFRAHENVAGRTIMLL